MVVATPRLLFLLISPIPFLHRRPFSLFRLAIPLTTLSAAPNHLRRNSTKFSQNYYSRATNNAWQENNHIPANGDHVSPSHPWPEWSRLVESLSAAGYFNVENDFVANDNLSMEFITAANSCLAFARDRADILRFLPRKDIEVLINSGYPFLFKTAHGTERRMRAFLQVEGSNEAKSVDLMKYILSYVSNPTIYPERNINGATESAARSLLQELSNFICRSQTNEQYEQMPRNLGPNITMKKGDWICQKCNFMNFARNTKCLECEEMRPQRQLTDGEWDCPRCNFFNYRKNVVCLKCECRRPDDASLPGSTYVQSRHTQDTDKEDKTERWFRKVKDLHNVTGPTFSRDDFSRNEENGFVDNKNNSRPVSHYQKSTSSFAPFVPFPPDYFTKKDNQQQPETLINGNVNTDSSSNQIIANGPKPEPSHIGQQSPNVGSGWTGKSLEGSAVTEPDPLDMSEEAKAERWFKRVAQIKDISELSQIPDEDFPSIMPMRKGVNRFVVSKRKTPLERRLTSPQYRKNLRIMSSEPMKKEDNE